LNHRLAFNGKVQSGRKSKRNYIIHGDPYLQSLLVKSRALQIDLKLQIFAELQTLRVRDGRQVLFLQLCNGVLIIPKIGLGSNKHNWGVWAMMGHLRVPLDKD
jgi:hypothetical protein